MKIVMQPAVSLDGFVAKLDGDSETWVNPEDEARYEKEVKRCGCLIVGRTTYEQYKASFDNYTDVMVFVCTSDASYVDQKCVKYLHGSAEEIIKEVEKYSFEELIVCGGGEINGLLADAGLVDEIVISFQPVVLGEGIPLFGSYKPNLKLELISVDQEVKGVIQNHYKVIKE